MIRQNRSRFVFFLLIAMIAAGPAAAQDTRPAVDLLGDYFDLLASGNLRSAEGLWTQPALERSSRFGIEYTDIPLKVDCSSPVVRNLPVMRDYLFPPVKRVHVLSGSDYVKLDYAALVDAEEIKHEYYAYFDGQYYWLTYAQDYFCREWPVMESRYFRIHYEPTREAYLHPVALEEADRYIEAAADSLDLSNEALALIGEKKIEYFFCDSDSTVEAITGFRVKGTLDLASNDVISAFFPHNHEVTHLLINLKLQEQALYVQPIVREGLAVYLGGRWGKGPAPLIYLGGFLHGEQLVEVDSIVTMDRFERHAGADMSYPVAGLFTAFLLERMGMDNFLELYQALSGTFEEVSGMTAPGVKRTIFEAAGARSWDELMADVDAYIEKYNSQQSVFGPGRAGRGRTLVDENGVRVSEYRRWVSVAVSSQSELPAGNIVFGYDDRLVGVRSLLFEEQYGGKTLAGYRWGIRFDGNEAGLYDYGSNQLIGKYIFGITPSDEYRDEQAHAIYVKYLIDLAEGQAPGSAKYELWPN